MLASLIPGIRQVRAPLSAGFLWFGALWLLIQPQWSTASAGRLASAVTSLVQTFSVIGQGVVISFIAYLLGSFSILAFSAPLARTIRTSRESSGPLSGLSENAKSSLDQIAVNGRVTLEREVGGMGTVDQVLEETAPAKRQSRTRVRRWRRRVEIPEGPVAGLPDPQKIQEEQIADRVLLDLPYIATTRLLGQRETVYTAADRIESEVEFRLALIPALVGFAIASAITVAPTSLILAIVLVLVGITAGAGLLLDAGRRRTQSNELLLSLIQFGSVEAPSLAQAILAAREIADRTPSRMLGRQLGRFSRAIERYFAVLDALPDTGVVAVLSKAHDVARQARKEAAALKVRLDRATHDKPAPSPLDIVDRLDIALAEWSAAFPFVEVESPAVQVPEEPRMSGDELHQHMIDAHRASEDFESSCIDLRDRLEREELGAAGQRDLRRSDEPSQPEGPR